MSTSSRSWGPLTGPGIGATGARIAEVGVELAVSCRESRGQVAGLPHGPHGALDRVGAPASDLARQLHGARIQLIVGHDSGDQTDELCGLHRHTVLADQPDTAHHLAAPKPT